MKKFDVIDNFLPEEDWQWVHNTMLSDKNFGWTYGDYINYAHDQQQFFQFEHLFYDRFQIYSEHYQKIINMFCDRLSMRSICRVKANLLTRTDKTEFHGWHVDRHPNDHDMIVGVYYVNTTNGKTLFEDGTEVDSIANRMLIFPGNILHSSTSCTDEKVRVVINFNWF